ncbi:MAG: acyltransferase family protein [Succinivibrio sp.]
MPKIIRHDVDFLKAIAILAVVLYHFFDLTNASMLTSQNLFSGGYVGVDVFLVLSGYLITSGIFSKLSENRFSFKDFYVRRFQRIVPPLAVMMLVVAAVGYFLVFPDIYKELGLEIRKCLSLLGNYRFSKDGGYFSLDSSGKLLLHTWYLCITFQFYIVWPIFLVLLNKLTGSRNLKYAVLVLFLLSLLYPFSSSKNGYLLSEFRLWELLSGATLCLFSTNIYAYVNKFRLVAVFQLVSFVVVILSVFAVPFYSVNSWTPYVSLLTVISTLVVLALNSDKTFLKSSPIEFIGKSSYSIYLWHWPVFIFALRLSLSVSVSNILLLAFILGAISFLSYKYVEKLKVDFKYALVLFLVTYLVGYGITKTDGSNYLKKYMVKELSMMVNESLDLPEEYKPSVFMKENNVLVMHYGLQTQTPHIFFIGDSHNEHYNYYLENINKIPVYSMVSEATIAYGQHFANNKVKSIVGLKERQTFYDLYKKMLSKLKAGDKVVLANRWDLYYTEFLLDNNLRNKDYNFPKYVKVLVEDITEQVEKHPELKFYIVGEGILLSNQVVDCLKIDLKGSVLQNILNSEKCKSTKNHFDDKVNSLNDTFKALTKIYPNLHFVERNKPLELANGFYRTYSDNGIPLFFDSAHFSSEGGILVGEYLMKEIEAE